MRAAAQKAGSTDPAKMQAAFKATDLKPEQLMMGYRGVKFDEKGQNTGVRAILQQVQKGRYVTVYPFELAAADVDSDGVPLPHGVLQGADQRRKRNAL